MMRASRDYGIRMMIAYEGKRAGEVIHPNPFFRQYLLDTERAEVVTEQPKREGPAIKCNRS
jgi:hypothetical protein